MSDPLKYLLVVGLLFPAISLVTSLLAWWGLWRYENHSSAVLIPLVGPILLTWWILLKGLSAWLIPVVWVLDIGTVSFFVVCPRLFREWWQISWFTRQLTLHGRQGIEAATLELHAGGHYLLRKEWDRPAGTFGIGAFGEVGTYIGVRDNYELTSHFGLRRILRSLDNHDAENSFLVSDEAARNQELREYSLDGWTLTTHTTTRADRRLR